MFNELFGQNVKRKRVVFNPLFLTKWKLLPVIPSFHARSVFSYLFQLLVYFRHTPMHVSAKMSSAYVNLCDVRVTREDQCDSRRLGSQLLLRSRQLLSNFDVIFCSLHFNPLYLFYLCDKGGGETRFSCVHEV